MLGYTPIFYAVYSGDMKIVLFLMEHGANIYV